MASDANERNDARFLPPPPRPTMGKMKAIACGGVHDLRAHWQRFYEQRRAAGQRGVEWQLDFRTWLEIWQASGHLHQRGRCKGSYQMCRSGDIGPYASSNVRIDLMENNASEAQAAKQRIRLARQEAACVAAEAVGTMTAPST